MRLTEISEFSVSSTTEQTSEARNEHILSQ